MLTHKLSSLLARGVPAVMLPTDHQLVSCVLRHSQSALVSHRSRFSYWFVASECTTTILPVVDWFSKSAQFNALQKLHSAHETVDLLVNYVFKLYGIPSDIVSELGLQFTSSV